MQLVVLFCHWFIFAFFSNLFFIVSINREHFLPYYHHYYIFFFSGTFFFIYVSESWGHHSFSVLFSLFFLSFFVSSLFFLQGCFQKRVYCALFYAVLSRSYPRLCAQTYVLAGKVFLSKCNGPCVAFLPCREVTTL